MKTTVRSFLILCIALALTSTSAWAKGLLKVGDKAPDFKLPATTGGSISLTDYIPKKAVVLYFYPKDQTSICTKEACSFRDSFEDFKTMGAEVIGVSADSIESHKKFIEKNRLPFVLVTDDKGELRKSYGVGSTMGMPDRVTFVIDRSGVVRYVFDSMMDSKKHVTEAMRILKEIDEKKTAS